MPNNFINNVIIVHFSAYTEVITLMFVSLENLLLISKEDCRYDVFKEDQTFENFGR
jgi:hypothetical protein